MGHPVGPLMRALARRVLANNEAIEKIEHRSADPLKPDAFADTQLLISLLGVLVFPHERASDLLGHLIENYPDVEETVTIRFFEKDGASFFPEDAGWSDAKRTFPLKDLPRYLRNSIAHFNILPIAEGEMFGGVRLWNCNDHGRITFVGDISFAKFRPFAEHILRGLSAESQGFRVDDPVDPLETLRTQPYSKQRDTRQRPPKLNSNLWDRLVEMHGSRDAAKTAVDRMMAAEVSNGPRIKRKRHREEAYK